MNLRATRDRIDRLRRRRLHGERCRACHSGPHAIAAVDHREALGLAGSDRCEPVGLGWRGDHPLVVRDAGTARGADDDADRRRRTVRTDHIAAGNAGWGGATGSLLGGFLVWNRSDFSLPARRCPDPGDRRRDRAPAPGHGVGRPEPRRGGIVPRPGSRHRASTGSTGWARDGDLPMVQLVRCAVRRVR